MKKSLFAMILMSLLLCGCQPESVEQLQLRIVDGAESGNLVLAGERASDVYILSVDGAAVNLDGKEADASALEDGMMIDIAYTGDINMTYPADLTGAAKSIDAYSLGTQQNPGGTLYDLSGLYLQVLDDLWAKDSGLNGGIQYVSVDLSHAPGNLTAGEKAAIAWIFGNKHGAEGLNLSSQQLADEGYLTEIVMTGSGVSMNEYPKVYQWENGVLFTITDNMADSAENYSLPVIKFNASKWRSPLGAYFFSDCSAVWPELGTWSGYNVEREAIS